MKVTINIEADAQEMREFLGLPEVKPLQDDMLQAIRDNVQQGNAGFDPMNLLKPLFPAQLQSMEMLQKAFADTFSKAVEDPSAERPAAKTPR